MRYLRAVGFPLKQSAKYLRIAHSISEVGVIEPLVVAPMRQGHPSDDTLGMLTLPIRCKLRGGRSWITPPPGAASATQTRRDPALVRALRLAHRLTAAMSWRSADGVPETLGTKAPTSPYHRRLCRLAFLAPDLQQAILGGRQPPALNLERLIHEPIPLAWPEQRRLYGEL